MRTSARRHGWVSSINDLRPHLFVLLLAVLATSSCALRGGPARSADVLAELKQQFNKDRGVPRLVVLVSPT
jgi:hypothetical protein